MFHNYTNDIDFDSYEDFYNNFKINLPDNFNFAYDVVDEIAKTNPNKIALVWCNNKGDEVIVTFKQLKQYSDKVSNLFTSLGVKKGDAVMLILKRRYEYWFCILALHKIGAVCIPATHLLTSKDIVYRNNAANVKMIVTVNEENIVNSIEEAIEDSPDFCRVLVGGNRENWVNFNNKIIEISDVFLRPVDEEQITTNDDISLIYFTSGTTGMPKMVQHNFAYPLGHIVTAKYWQCVQEDGLHLTVADTGWAKAAWGKIYGQWLCGSAVFVYDYDKFVPRELLEKIVEYKVTTFCAPPTIYRFFIKEDLTKYDLSNITHCSIAGEPLNPEVFNQFLNATGLKLMEGYGQTEATVIIGTFPWIEPKPGSMGKPSPGYNIDLLNEYGVSCDVGEEGEIIIRTDLIKPFGMFTGYYQNQRLTDTVWHNNIYHTGDMAWRDEDGYLWFVGRADDVIKSSGYRIGPFEVESALIEHPAVLECAITAVPDPVRGQIVKATVVLSKGYAANEDLKIKLQDHVKKVTAPYKYPRIIEFVSELPKTISGKIRRVEIKNKDNKYFL